MSIQYTKLVDSYTTKKYGNLMRGTVQGQVKQNSDGAWDGWVYDADRGNDFRFDFANRAAAARWVNNKLRERGVTE